MSLYLLAFLRRITPDRKGVTALEYAALAVGIVSAIAVGAAVLGHGVSGLFATVISDMKSAGA